MYQNLLWYWFSEDFLTQSSPLCTSIVSSNQITRTLYHNSINKNGHCYHRRTLCGWCKCHYEFLIATSLYPYYYSFKAVIVTGSHSLPYSLVLNVWALTPWYMNLSYFLKEHTIKHNHKLITTPPSTIMATTDDHHIPINHKWINRKMSCIKTSSDTGSPRTFWPNLAPFVPLSSHPIRSLGHIMTTSSSIMGIAIIEKNCMTNLSAIMSS